MIFLIHNNFKWFIKVVLKTLVTLNVNFTSIINLYDLRNRVYQNICGAKSSEAPFLNTSCTVRFLKIVHSVTPVLCNSAVKSQIMLYSYFHLKDLSKMTSLLQNLKSLRIYQRLLNVEISCASNSFIVKNIIINVYVIRKFVEFTI